MRSYSSKVVVITGAGSGIGAALTRCLAREGAALVLAGRREDKLRAVVAQCGDARTLVVPTDVSKIADLKALVEAAVTHFGHIDVLINNAGVAYGGSLGELDPTEIQHAVNVNLTAPLLLTHLVEPRLRARPEAQIVNIASMSGLLALPTQSVYVATKFGLRGFGDSLRREFRDSKISVCTVFPGVVATEITPPEFLASAEKAGLPMRPIDADVAAARIVDGMRRNQPWILVATLAERIAWRLHDWMPAIFDRVAAIMAPRMRILMSEGLRLFRARSTVRPARPVKTETNQPRAENN